MEKFQLLEIIGAYAPEKVTTAIREVEDKLMGARAIQRQAKAMARDIVNCAQCHRNGKQNLWDPSEVVAEVR